MPTMYRHFAFALLAVVTLASQALAALPPAHERALPFTAPAGWNCTENRQDWVCTQPSAEGKLEALLVFSAQSTQGAQSADSLEALLTELQAPRHQNTANPELFSKPEFAKKVSLNGKTWIHARHFESEIPGFTTEYFATLAQGRAVRVTLSARKESFAKIQPELQRLVEKLTRLQ